MLLFQVVKAINICWVYLTGTCLPDGGMQIHVDLPEREMKHCHRCLQRPYITTYLFSPFVVYSQFLLIYC